MYIWNIPEANRFVKLAEREGVSKGNIKGVPKDAWIHVLVGDIQKMKVYAERGLQEYVNIPNNVWEAYEELVNRGYNKDLLLE